jgi:UDP-N-acetylmuramoylalanine--D-glutamate ligase
MSTALFAHFAPATLIGITGTKGKSTTTHIIHHTLQQAQIAVHLGGNVSGVSTLAMLPHITPSDVVVLELDSWQLQGFHTENISPQYAVFTNFMEDHMNYYKGDMDAYFYDKSAIFAYQNESDVFVTQRAIQTYATNHNYTTNSNVYTTVDDEKTSFTLPHLPGAHNQTNAAMAHHILRSIGLDDETITKGYATCPALPGRLQCVSSDSTVLFYNDTNATIPNATRTSLITLTKTFPEKEIVIIAGGSYKDVSVSEFARDIRKYTSKIVLLDGTGTEKLLEHERDTTYTKHTSLRSAFAEAIKDISDNSIVLLSPGLSSFGMFKNEYDRGEQFNALVEEYVTSNK